MKRITIQSLQIKDFKGIKALSLQFKDGTTNISGANATGKTSIVDAFTWLLFDKDSLGRSDFNIKPMGSHYLESTVEGNLNVNGEIYSLKKIFREKWIKPRGQSESVFSGHETVYSINDVVKTQKEYNKVIDEICPEKLFKLLTNPLYFPKLPWQEQRQMLFSVAGDVTNDELIAINPAFAAILKSLNGHNTLAELKKQIQASKKKTKELLEQIPTRIDEVTKGLPEPMMWDKIEEEIKDLTDKIKQIDEKIANAGKGLEGENQKRLDIQQVIYKHQESKRKLEYAATQHIDEIKRKQDIKLLGHRSKTEDIRYLLQRAQSDLKYNTEELEEYKKSREAKIAAWKEINAETITFNDLQSSCPTCGQELPEEHIRIKKDEMITLFNQNKKVRLDANVSQGKAIAEKIKAWEQKVQLLTTQISELSKQLEEAEAFHFEAIPEEVITAERKAYLNLNNYQSVLDAIEANQKELAELGPVKVADTSALQSQKATLNLNLNALQVQLAKKTQIDAGHKRIDELKAEQQDLSQQLANLEQKEFTILEIDKTKVDLVESRINEMFRVVRWKMFNQQVNGGESETCECTVNDVPYSDVNNAGKINAGLDIISALSKIYDFYAPIAIDNRESVNELLPVDTQVINLYVTEDKELFIN